MKLVLFEATPGRDPVPGLLTDRGVVSIASAVRPGHTPQATMQNLIDDFESLRPALTRLAREGEARPLADVRLRAPPVLDIGQLANSGEIVRRRLEHVFEFHD